MNEVQASTKPFPNQGAAAWIDAYQEEILTTKDEATIEAYTRILEKFAVWLSLHPGNSGRFHPQTMTRTAIEGFLETLPSYSYKKQARRPLWLLSLVARRPAAAFAQSGPGCVDPRTGTPGSSGALQRPALCDP